MQITIFNEYSKGQKHGKCLKSYPKGLHVAIKEIFDGKNINTICCTQDQDSEHGLSEKVLRDTDVLIWWGHCLHQDVNDLVVDRVVRRVEEGMGIIFLHSSHFSKPFKRLMGTSCSLRWREAHDSERVWSVMPSHPIATDVEQGFRLKREEMYGEHFDIPAPDEVVFVGWFSGGEVFRSGCTFHYGKGKIFYFQCGHESFPIYYNQNVKKIIFNAAMWASGNPPKNNFEPEEICKFSGIGPERVPFFRR